MGYYGKLSMDFQTNKKITEDVAIVQSKRMRNKIAGYVTHLMKRIQRGPVRGISLKLQEEERERRMDFEPDESAVDLENIEVDPETQAMLRSLDMPTSCPRSKLCRHTADAATTATTANTTTASDFDDLSVVKRGMGANPDLFCLG